MALSKGAIIGAGLSILDAYGLGDLSMRRVAETLGVQAGALYYHVPNKQSLLAALSDEIVRAALPPADGVPCDEWLTMWAVNLRAALLGRRDGAELVAASLAMGLGEEQPVDRAADMLAAAGAEEPEATAATLLHFVLGHAVEEQTRFQLSELGVVTGFDTALAEHRFAWGVRLIVRGAGPVGGAMSDDAPVG